MVLDWVWVSDNVWVDDLEKVSDGVWTKVFDAVWVVVVV